MQNLTELSPTTQHQELARYIKEYNQLTGERPIEKIFLLQKISHFIEKAPTDLEIHNWRNLLQKNGLEAHLQYFDITRDGSSLVKNIQFASAIQRYAPTDDTSDLDYFSALQARDVILNDPDILLPNTDTLTKYLQYNQIIMSKFDSDPGLQEKYARSQYFLSLCYSKMEAIKGFVDQSFPTFQTHKLGRKVNENNKNFTLEVDGEDKQLVIRVEDRESMANEAKLQTYPVSDYFSEEYYTMMLPFTEQYSDVYRPVVLTEYVEKGGLDDYAGTLTELSAADITRETQHMFGLLSDFSIKLIASGHYHPDIKLSNFLTDGHTIKVSDRKTITNKSHPTPNDVFSTITFAPPEYLACLNTFQTAINHMKARNTMLDMPSFMSYQIGMALKEFVLTAFDVQTITLGLYTQWLPVTTIIKQPSKVQKNLFILIQELTRHHPQDRLSIEHFQRLLTQIHLPPNAFLVEVEALSPRTQLLHAQEIELMQQILDTPELTPSLQKKWDELEQTGLALEIYADPRLRFLEKASLEIKTYLNKIDEIMASTNRRKVSSLRLVGSFLGVIAAEIPKIEELPALPVMPDKIKRYYEILEAMPTTIFDESDIEKLRYIQLRQNSMQPSHAILDISTNSSPLTSTPDESEANSPVSGLSDPEVLSVDSLDTAEFDSGTFIRVPIATGPGSKQSATTTEDEDFDTGTFVRLPEQKTAHTHTQIFRKLVKDFQEDTKKSPRSKKASDINTTINRGNKI